MSSPFPHRNWNNVELEDVTIYKFSKDMVLDEQDLQLVGESLFSLVSDRPGRNVILDLSRIEHISSAALGKITTLNKRLKGLNGNLVFMGVPKGIADGFTTTRLDKLIPMVETESQAYELLGLTELSQRQIAEDESPLTGVLTAEEILEIEQDGITLGDAIRSMKSS